MTEKETLKTMITYCIEMLEQNRFTELRNVLKVLKRLVAVSEWFTLGDIIPAVCDTETVEKHDDF